MQECRFCKTQVREDAVKCPACAEWLKPWSLRGPWTQITGIFIVTASFIGAQSFFGEKLKTNLETTIFSTPKAEIVFSEKIASKGDLSVIGQVKNTGPSSVISTTIEVSFFDKANKLVNVGNTYLSGKFEKDEVRPFKVKFTCGDKELAPGDYDHYTINIR